MSYILDALKKAAEQRNTPAPEVRRLLAPAPVSSDGTARYITLGAALVGAVGMIAIVWLWQSSPESPTRPVAAVNVVAPDRAPVDAARRDEPGSSPRRDAPASLPPTTSSETRAQPPTPVAKVPAVPAKPSRPTPFAPSAPESRAPIVSHPLPPASFLAPPASSAPPPVVTAPAPQTPPPRVDASGLRLEVIVYSDERPKRMVFINGRKYVEGDTVRDGARIEEIQSNAVVINEDGRRVTLRP